MTQKIQKIKKYKLEIFFLLIKVLLLIAVIVVLVIFITMKKPQNVDNHKKKYSDFKVKFKFDLFDEKIKKPKIIANVYSNCGPCSSANIKIVISEK